MKTKINHILPVLLLTAASGLTTVSCNDFLDKTPDNRTELNTDQKIAKLLVSAYPRRIAQRTVRTLQRQLR